MAATASPVMIRLSALLIAVLAVCCPAPASSAPPPLGKRYRVGGLEGWRVPPPEDKEMFYVKWASPITFFVEDSIEFVYRNDTVIKVSKAGYYHCNETAGAGTGPAPKDGSTLFLLDAPGFAYFASADLGHCADGQRLMINVLAAQPPAPASSSFAPAQAPTAPSSSSQSWSSPPFSPALGPAPSMEYSSATPASFVPALARAVVPAATLVLVLPGFI